MSCFFQSGFVEKSDEKWGMSHPSPVHVIKMKMTSSTIHFQRPLATIYYQLKKKSDIYQILIITCCRKRYDNYDFRGNFTTKLIVEQHDICQGQYLYSDNR